MSDAPKLTKYALQVISGATKQPPKPRPVETRIKYVQPEYNPRRTLEDEMRICAQKLRESSEIMIAIDKDLQRKCELFSKILCWKIIKPKRRLSAPKKKTRGRNRKKK